MVEHVLAIKSGMADHSSQSLQSPLTQSPTHPAHLAAAHFPDFMAARDWQSVHITVNELVPVVIAAALWGRPGQSSVFTSSAIT